MLEELDRALAQFRGAFKAGAEKVAKHIADSVRHGGPADVLHDAKKRGHGRELKVRWFSRHKLDHDASH